MASKRSTRWAKKRTARESVTKHDTYTWRMVTGDIRRYGPALAPHLIIKRPHLELLLEYLGLLVPGPAANPNWDRCLEIQAEIRRLNRVGKEKS